MKEKKNLHVHVHNMIWASVKKILGSGFSERRIIENLILYIEHNSDDTGYSKPSKIWTAIALADFETVDKLISRKYLKLSDKQNEDR